MKLLHIDASILGDNSVSRQLSAATVERLRAETPGLEIAYRDLAAEPPGHFTAAHIGGQGDSAEILDEFLAADIVVIGAPMYNFTVPSQLKAWIDRIMVAGKTFQYGASGVEGLAGNKRVILVLSRGNFYAPGTPAAAVEHLESYLRSVFGYVGITAPEIIAADGIGIGPEQRAQAIDGALEAVAELKAA